MASLRKIQGITIEINGDTTKLGKALKDVNKQLSSTQSDLREVNKLLKLDPKNTELLKQKQEKLKTAIDDTKKKLDQEKEALKQLKTSDGTEQTKAQQEALTREIANTEQELKNLEKEYKTFGSVASQEVQAAGKKMEEVGKKVSGVGQSISDVGKGMTTYITLPIAAAGTAAANKFADVDKTMQLTNKTMNNTAEQADMLSQAMKDAASNSTFGMSDAADATLNFARAGLSAEQAAAALAPAMNLAAGEGGNLDTVSAGLVATINGFGDSFENTSKYADVFAAACNNSALDVDSLSNAMSVAAPTFRTAGKGVDEAALALGVMANAGIDANTAATSLKTGLARLASPTKQARDAMDQYGITMDQIWNPDGTMKSMVEIQKNLHESFGKLSEQEQMAAASAIFGKNQMSAWMAVVNAAPDDVDKLSKSISNAAGTTDEMAEAMMSGFGGSLEKLKSSIDVLLTTLGETLAPMITKVTERIQKVVDWLNKLDKGSRQRIVKIALIVAALGPLLLVIGKTIIGIGNLITAVGKITVTVGKLMPVVSKLFSLLSANPYVLVIAGIVAVVAALVTLYKNCESFRNFVNGMAKAVVSGFKTMMTGIGESLKRIGQNIAENWRDMTRWATKMKSKGLEAAQNLVTGLVSGIQAMMSRITQITSRILNIFKNAAQQAYQWGRDLIYGFINGIMSWANKLINKVAGIAGKIRSFLHFSRPDEGPLRDYETWMPDFMKGLAKGIDQNAWRVSDALTKATSGLQIDPNITGQLQLAGGIAMPEQNITVMVGNKQFDSYIVKTSKAGINNSLTSYNRGRGK